MTPIRWKMMLIRTFLVAVWVYPDRIVLQTTVDEAGTVLSDGETADIVASVDLCYDPGQDSGCGPTLFPPPLPAVL